MARIKRTRCGAASSVYMRGKHLRSQKQVLSTFLMYNLVTYDLMKELETQLFGPVGAGLAANGEKIHFIKMHMRILKRIEEGDPAGRDQAFKDALDTARVIYAAYNARQTFSAYIAQWTPEKMILLEEKVCGAAGPHMSEQGVLQIHARIVRHIQTAHPTAEKRDQAYQAALQVAQALY